MGRGPHWVKRPGLRDLAPVGSGGRSSTWHGEMKAIRKACKKLGSFKLKGCKLYTSVEPCPMCAAASYWAGIEQIFYGATVDDALEYGGFDDSMIFAQLRHPTQSRTLPAQRILRAEAVEIWKKYKEKPDKVPY